VQPLLDPVGEPHAGAVDPAHARQPPVALGDIGERQGEGVARDDDAGHLVLDDQPVGVLDVDARARLQHDGSGEGERAERHRLSRAVQQGAHRQRHDRRCAGVDRDRHRGVERFGRFEPEQSPGRGPAGDEQRVEVPHDRFRRSRRAAGVEPQIGTGRRGLGHGAARGDDVGVPGRTRQVAAAVIDGDDLDVEARGRLLGDRGERGRNDEGVRLGVEQQGPHLARVVAVVEGDRGDPDRQARPEEGEELGPVVEQRRHGIPVPQSARVGEVPRERAGLGGEPRPAHGLVAGDDRRAVGHRAGDALP
jgi:hypothetical protein